MARRKDDMNRSAREHPEERAVYIISVAAELAGVHPQTLRIYERRGLLRPARTAGNTRRYSARDIERLRLIQKLTQEHGLNLAGVQMILDMEDQLERMRRRMERLDRDLERARLRMEAEVARVRRQGSSGELVPLSSLRDLLMQIGIAAAEESSARHEESMGRRTPIPLGPSRLMDRPAGDGRGRRSPATATREGM
jgi:MerR family transcriptional regulator, heat shock protein HspR